MQASNTILESIKSLVFEFDMSEIYSPKQLAATLTAEAILLATLKASVNHLLETSKSDRKLSRQLSDITSNNYDVRVIDDVRIFSLDVSGTIYISHGLVRLLDDGELLGVMLHEIGHGEEKIKVLINYLTKNPRNPRKLRSHYKMLAKMIDSSPIRRDPKMMARVYMITYITYISTADNPFKGLYKWSYGDMAVKYGYWDEYASALRKINRYINRQAKSKLAVKFAEVESGNPGASQNLGQNLHRSLSDSSTDIDRNIDRLILDKRLKPEKKSIFKYIKSIF